MHTSVDPPVIEEVGRSAEALAAELALVVALARVHAPVNNQRVLAGKRLAAKLATLFANKRGETSLANFYNDIVFFKANTPLILLDPRVEGREVVLEIAPLTELATALVALVGPGACKAQVKMRLRAIHTQKTLHTTECLPVWTRMCTLRAPLAKNDLPQISL